MIFWMSSGLIEIMTDPKNELASGKYSSEKAEQIQIQKTRRGNGINNFNFIVTRN